MEDIVSCAWEVCTKVQEKVQKTLNKKLIAFGEIVQNAGVDGDIVQKHLHMLFYNGVTWDTNVCFTWNHPGARCFMKIEISIMQGSH